MKKITFFAAAAVAVVVSSCSSTPSSKADLKTDIDSLSYAAGMTIAQDLPNSFQNMGIDTTEVNIKEFLRGLNEGMNSSGDKKKEAYYAGIQTGQQFSNRMVKGLNYQVFGNDTTKTISIKNFMAGFMAGATKKGVMPVDSATQFFQKKMESYQAKRMEEQFSDNKKDGEAYMAKIAKTEDVKALGKGVYYKVITEGTGAVPVDTSLVKVNYEGKLIDGTKFESSYDRKQPLTTRANQVIPGWTEALTHMPVGSKWEVYIPQEQGYGARGGGSIKPYSALVFTVELLSIEK